MEKKQAISVIWSETWLDGATITQVADILEGTINDFAGKAKIINVEKVKSENGLNRFWVYLQD